MLSIILPRHLSHGPLKPFWLQILRSLLRSLYIQNKQIKILYYHSPPSSKELCQTRPRILLPYSALFCWLHNDDLRDSIVQELFREGDVSLPFLLTISISTNNNSFRSLPLGAHLVLSHEARKSLCPMSTIKFGSQINIPSVSTFFFHKLEVQGCGGLCDNLKVSFQILLHYLFLFTSPPPFFKIYVYLFEREGENG